MVQAPQAMHRLGLYLTLPRKLGLIGNGTAGYFVVASPVFAIFRNSLNIADSLAQR
jgi:hypothetical protein